MSTALWSLELAQLLGLNQVLLAPNGLSADGLFNRFYDLVARETKITGVLFECQVRRLTTAKTEENLPNEITLVLHR